MEEETTESKKPTWKGVLEVAGWTKKDKNGKEFISLKIGQYCNLFKVEQ
jgi:hypothetical protein